MKSTCIPNLETKDFAREAASQSAQQTISGRVSGQFASPMGSPDAAGALEQLHNAHTQYTQTNDTRLAELEQKSSADVLLDEKLARLDEIIDGQMRHLNEIQLKSQRLPRSKQEAPGGRSVEVEHKSAFDTYMRDGQEARLKGLEQKAMSSGAAADGGYLVPELLETDILRRITTLSPIRSIASNRKISGASYRRPVVTINPDADWEGETDARSTPTNGMKFELRDVKIFELAALPAVTQTLLDDAAVNIGEILAEEVETVFAEKESAAFITGNGTSQPQGLLSGLTHGALDDTGLSIGYIKTGAAGVFPSENPGDLLISLIYGVKTPFRRNARFLFNRRTQSAIRKLKDGQGNYLWQPPAASGAEPSLMGFPVTEAEHMPDMTAGSDPFAIAFGDFHRGYMVVDRVGISMLRDPYTSKPNVLFYITKRVGGGIMDFDAYKLLSFSA
ncbi:Phage capsid family protein [Pseudovibrio axinellae]|uniref:Phage capsid family protein n=1 Tax=Pseudovibrio axinellae TaxID=989403 RepID=A0A166AES7_9HYPH|nr:phage major capsid protein [Pseudovibrio axinellae]KZL20976.1 Phage capsid family protein [Pseudovibrio axinellae]SEP80555.1 phage major capsid protein, HK97 family [Pseudovibrio axinellae]